MLLRTFALSQRRSRNCYPRGCAATSSVQCQCNARGSLSKLAGVPPRRKINVTSKSPVGDISVVTLIRTDTTLDHIQKAEKVWTCTEDSWTHVLLLWVLRRVQMRHCSPVVWAPRTVFEQNGLSCVSYAQQRSLHPILVYFPTTAGSAQFCLLCCQPEPIPGSSTVRMSQFTLWDPYRLPAWLG